MPRPAKPTDHLDEIRHLMGTMPDHEVAKKCDSTPSIVGRYRRKHGIPAYEGYKFGKGQRPPSKVSEQAAKNKTPRRRRSKIDAFRSQVGKIPDQVIAKKAGVSVEGVRMYRRRHNITLEPEVRRRRGSKTSKPTAPTAPVVRSTGPSVLDSFRDQFGSVPDSEIAVMADITEAEATAYRTAHGIAAAAEPPAPRRHAAPPTAMDLQGYSVTIDGVDHIVVAADIADAAERAVRARLSGAITAIHHLGTALVAR